METNENQDQAFVALINSRIESLRRKLLDLRRSNPLINTRFSEKSNSHIRVIDELPNQLFSQLNEKEMELAPLPPLDDDPKDEDSREFQARLSGARLTDEGYSSAIKAIDRDDPDEPQLVVDLERALKDRLRDELGMAPRQTKKSLSLSQHARNNHILPSYDLPEPSNVHEDGRHEDEYMQTMLTPELLERKANAMLTKCRTWVQETGIAVEKAAFGFLEWFETPESKPSLAPLILMPIEIKKKKTHDGNKFIVSSLGDDIEHNTALAEKLKQDFGLALPEFNSEMTPEEYFVEVGKLQPMGMKWRVRRQMAIGVFPSARMAMYKDLDTSGWNFGERPVIRDLFGSGDNNGGASPFGDDYDVDEPQIAAKVPLLVMDADSSQFSAMVDVADGKNLAVEGPPGTGKSQTIVNTIAAMLAQGKKILFVAEKTAALEVVRSRLEAAQLGPFLLTLQANRSSKDQVIKSIRERINLRREMHPRDYEDVLKNYKKTRDKLQTYIDCVSSSFGNTGITVYEVLGNAIAATPTLQTLLDDVRKLPIAAPARIDKSAIADIVSACDNLEAAWNDAKQNRDFWMGIGISNIDPFSADEILQNAKGSSEKWQIAHEKRLSLSTLGISKGSDMGYLTQLQTALRTVPEQIALIDMKLVARLKSEKNIAELRAYLGAVEEAQKVKAAYDTIFFESLQADLGRRIEETEAICRTNDLLRISTSELDRKIEKTEQLINELSDGVSLCEEILNQLREASEIKIQYLLQACKLATQSERDVLSVRDRKYEKPETREFLKKYQAEAASLKQRQKLVREVFDIDACPDIDEIEEHSKILLNASIFSFFTVKYHSSKKFYKSIALDGKWHRKDAIKKMRSLLAYLKGNRAFSNDAAIKALLGNNYDGMNTNFDLFEKLLNFYEDIDNGLRGLSDPYLREFMCTAEIESIFSLPQVDPGHVLNNFKSKTPASIREDLLKLRKKYESLKTASVALESLIPLFKVPEAFDVQELKKEAADIKTFQAHWLELNSSQEIRVMLGDYFKGALTDRELIEPSLKVAECAVLLKGHDVSYLEAIEKRAIPQYLEIIERVINTTAEAEGSLEALAALVQCGLDFLKRGQTFAELAKHLHEAAEDKAGLIAYSSVALCSNEIKALGYEKILLKLSTQTDFHIGLADKIGALICQAMAREVYASHGEVLSSYNGVMLDNLRKKLASLDREIMTLSQKYLRSKLIREANLSTGSRSGKRSEWTDMALLNHEITKKGRYIPVRDMTSRAGAALMEIKPCWMLSPLAVAQYIKKGQAGFDLVIIDEASQMTPEDAVGALARGEQAMVVGDTNQLPPMSFFQKHFEEDDDDDAEVLTEESILEMSNAILRPARRLKWHYRSRDESLIAFSNKYIYDNELVIFPSPTIKNPDMGVSLESVKGLYSKGTNPEEAKVMIDAAVNFMRNNPQKSLGVVVLNQKQRDLLLEEFNFVLANDSSVQRYVDSWENTNDGLEQFFIKNLENVQGDERDAIFIGTVYGPEKEGAPVMQRFGPINGVTGKRRLNVLFTRAKQRIVTFSSMTGSDIRADDSNVGVSMLKKWLEYSATGTLLTDDILQNRREPDSMFEQYVINQLKTIGCEVTPQVGIAGYFIDIGISHPQWPHGYIMGVECDGATYHSSKSARDRDRLREEVLRGLGWHLHRIWSTDWFDDPIKQTQRLRQAVEDRLEELQQEMASPQ